MKLLALHDFYNHGAITLPADTFPAGTSKEVRSRVVPMGTIFKIGGDTPQTEMSDKDPNKELIARLFLAGMIGNPDDKALVTKTQTEAAERKARRERQAALEEERRRAYYGRPAPAR